jgi:hypothetical protein
MIVMPFRVLSHLTRIPCCWGVLNMNINSNMAALQISLVKHFVKALFKKLVGV